MYKEKQEQLFIKINNIIKEVDYRSLKETVGIELRKRNLDSSIIILASEIIQGNAKLEQLVNEEDNDIKLLFFFAYALNQALTGDKAGAKIVLENYFLKSEVDELKDYKVTFKTENVFPIVIQDVNMINDHHFEGVISGEFMHKLNSAKVPIYNPNTQRNPKATSKGDKINVNPNKVLAIRDEILSGEYEPDHIKWNILKNGNEKFNYNPKNKTLTIFEGSTINIVDGMHRKEANSAAYAINSDVDIKWGLTIYNVSEIKAHGIMVQINKQTPMNEEWLETKDYNKPENRVLSVMADEKSKLFDIMKETDKHITKNQALVKKSNITQAISEIYGEDLLLNGEADGDNIRSVGRWLAEFFDYMLKLYSYDFKENPYEVKLTSFINWKNMFYGYIALSKVLQDKDDWKESFKAKMQSLDFNMTNPSWQNIGMLNTKDANATLRKTLYNMFKEGVE